MNVALVFTLAVSLVFTTVKATLQRDVITYINVFRHLHAVGPLLVDDVIQKSAQNAATIFMKAKSKDSVPIYRYSANFCTYSGSAANLDRTCVITWYVSMKYYIWCYPRAEGQALPFINMIWKASTKAGVGIAKANDGTFYVVVYIALQDENNVAGNVPPVKIVMEASPKAKCPTGYARFGTSCFKYETTAVTWDEAVTRCARENATLASIRNAKEEEFVRDLQKKTGSGLETWIGLHDSLHEGRFKWFDGLRFHKHVCVPVHADGGNLENCVAWSINKPKGCWDDRRCNEKIPFTCRIPIEGKSTYRTEVLFKKFRWRPNYKDKTSKAYRDLVNGIKITFKEIFTRMSGKKKGGFRKVKIKGVRAISFKGRPAGLGIAVSIKFRSFTPDPTLRFQKFLRPSEKLISMAIDKPDKVVGKTGKAGKYCYGTCGHQSRCSASLQPSHGYYPRYPAPSPPPYATPAYSVYYPGGVQTVTSSSDPYPSWCPMSCSQHPTLDCYMQCNDECCESRDGKRKWKTNGLTDKTKEKFGNLNKPNFSDDKVVTFQDNTDNATRASDGENANNGISDDLIDKERKRPKHKPNASDDKVLTSQDSIAQAQAHSVEDTENVIADDLIERERKRPTHKPNASDDKVLTSQDSIAQAQAHSVEDTENVIADDLIEKEWKRPSHKPNALGDKVIASQDNVTQTHTVEEAENIIAALKKTIKSLQIRLKEKNRSEVDNQLDKLLNDSVESNEDYNSTTLNETELSSYEENKNDKYGQGKNESTRTSHDLINDDDQEPLDFDKGGLNDALENDARTTMNKSSFNEESSPSITNNGKEPGVEYDALVNEESKINPTQSPSVQITNEIIDDRKKLNKNLATDMEDHVEKSSQETNEDESRSGNNETEAQSELGLYSLRDSAIDPTEELLDEEAIDDAGKFGRKRNLIRKHKKSH